MKKVKKGNPDPIQTLQTGTYTNTRIVPARIPSSPQCVSWPSLKMQMVVHMLCHTAHLPRLYILEHIEHLMGPYDVHAVRGSHGPTTHHHIQGQRPSSLISHSHVPDLHTPTSQSTTLLIHACT